MYLSHTEKAAGGGGEVRQRTAHIQPDVRPENPQDLGHSTEGQPCMVDSRSLRQHSCLEEDSGSLGLPHCKGGAAGGQAGRETRV